MYNLIEYSDSYSKTSGSLREYCKEIPAVNNNGNIVDFNLILKQKLRLPLIIIMVILLGE